MIPLSPETAEQIVWVTLRKKDGLLAFYNKVTSSGDNRISIEGRDALLMGSCYAAMQVLCLLGAISGSEFVKVEETANYFRFVRSDHENGWKRRG
jgi:hypothetical protein